MRAPAASGPFEDGLDAYNTGDYATALRLWRPLAAGGNAAAQYTIGIMYDNGQGVAQDYAGATKWYRLAAEQGFAAAQLNLGGMYADKASSWVARLRASLGLGVPQDGVQAYKWFDLAASRFSASEKESRDLAVENRDLVAAELTPAQIAEARKLAQEWKPRGEQAE